MSAYTARTGSRANRGRCHRSVAAIAKVATSLSGSARRMRSPWKANIWATSRPPPRPPAPSSAYKVNSDFAGSTIKVDGQSLLTGDHATTATASIANLPVDRVLALAGRRDLPFTGLLSTNAQVSGTLADPHANIALTLTNATAYQEKFDRPASQHHLLQSARGSVLSHSGGGPQPYRCLRIVAHAQRLAGRPGALPPDRQSVAARPITSCPTIQTGARGHTRQYRRMARLPCTPTPRR